MSEQINQFIHDSLPPSDVIKGEEYWRSHQAAAQAVKVLFAGEQADPLVDYVLDSEAEKSGLRADLEHHTALSQTDPLTGAVNRRGFTLAYDKLHWATQPENKRSSEKDPIPTYLFSVDIDNFKSVNDALGHDGGDKVLIAVVECLMKNTREGTDVIGRLGGDELAALLPYVSKERALEIADKVRLQILETTATGLSIGITEVDYKLSLAENVDRADQALYAAKESRNTVVMYEPTSRVA